MRGNRQQASDANHRVHVIGAGEWQAARPLREYTLVGCTVGPGFEFEDFEMKPGSVEGQQL